MERIVKMNVIKSGVRVKLVRRRGLIPTYATEGSVGADVYSANDVDEYIAPGRHKLIPLGIAVQIPEGFELQLRPRSGLARQGIFTMLGTIDPDYRGEVCAEVYNFSESMFRIEPGMRIGQFVLAPVAKAIFVQTDMLDETKRGDRGFGSTGIR